jgi:hypothetical protein
MVRVRIITMWLRAGTRVTEELGLPLTKRVISLKVP